jgi:DNA mismatch repair protein MutL
MQNLATSERPPIRLLPPTLINQIAAGEVIVRPASVVKELLENALDAGATRLGIVVADDGRSITVTDDGFGIPAEQMETALLRHATSKIASFEDVSALETRGFRGEALASIASVAHVRLTSRAPEAEAGSQIEAKGGEVSGRRPVGAPAGTRVEVTELFANVPARRKFLRSPQAEFNAVLRAVIQQALSQPDIGITLERITEAGRQRVLELPAEQTLRDRLAQVLGAQVAEHLVALDLTEGDHLITGFLARPNLATRSDSRGQLFFVNGRPVINRRLGFALRQACAGMIMAGRHPIAAVFIECPPELVDVNVHPTKDEVRFQDEDRVAGIIYRAAQAALTGSDLRPRLDLGSPGVPYSAPPEGVTPSPAMPLQWGGQASAATAPPGQQSTFTIPLSLTSPPERPPAPPRPSDLSAADAESPSANQPTSESTVLDPLLTEEMPIEPLGQVGNSYIVASCGEDLLVIDQHAAHERLMYHRVQRQFEQRRPAQQPLLVPLSFDLPATVLSHLDEMTPVFARLGIEIESFGGQTVIVRSLPADFENVDIAQVIQDVAADIERGDGAPAAADVRERVLTGMACHAAVKANRPMTLGEMRALIAEIIRARLPHTCPHGRPTMALLTREQLDRQFKRK